MTSFASQAKPTKFENTTARGLRVTETGKNLLSFSAACNPPASNSPGIGITVTTPATAPLPPTTAVGMQGWNWTLLTQGFKNPNVPGAVVAPVARTPQVGQVIGGNGDTPRTGNQQYTWDQSQALYSVAGATASGGVSGNGAAPNAQTQFIVGVTNPVNVNGAVNPAYPAPVVIGAAQLATLAAGWVLV